ncbi:MAG: hydroxymethylbilane synthase [Beijerinckiaceae bacterium]|jgi:hydroxymethylbilane synthase|nr:hydroxymethylbilane synthase [Beijerinckiaceae bacterium]
MSDLDRPFIIGTRGSPLALAQARMTREALIAVAGLVDAAIRTEIISTTGDQTQDRPLSEIGGKGLFTKEIDIAQLEGRVDIAVHSAKDLPTLLPEGLEIAGCLPREDCRDAVIAPRHGTLANLPQGARVGTVSLRRQALIRRMRPDLRVEALRGNVGTRLEKARTGEFDAVILAMAGLKRLGLDGAVTEVLERTEFIPAVGQGAVALVTRVGDARVRRVVDAITHGQTGIELAAERAFLTVLDGSCRTPIGGNATVDGTRVVFRGIVLTPDGVSAQSVMEEAPLAEAARLGERLGHVLKARQPQGLALA